MSSEPTTPRLTVASISARLAELRAMAIEDRGLFYEDSVDDLALVFASVPIIRVPSLFLMDNGNIKISWHRSAHKHASFELLGYGKTKVILFWQDDGSQNELHGRINVFSIANILRSTGFGQWILE